MYCEHLFKTAFSWPKQLCINPKKSLCRVHVKTENRIMAVPSNCPTLGTAPPVTGNLYAEVPMQ